MINPDTPAAQIVTLAGRIPEIAARLTNGITYYQENNSGVSRAVYSMPLNSALLVYLGYEIASIEAGSDAYAHRYSLYVRLGSGTFGSFLKSLLDGVPTGSDGMSFLNQTLPEPVSRMDISSAIRVPDENIEEYFELTITVYDKGWA